VQREHLQTEFEQEKEKNRLEINDLKLVQDTNMDEISGFIEKTNQLSLDVKRLRNDRETWKQRSLLQEERITFLMQQLEQAQTESMSLKEKVNVLESEKECRASLMESIDSSNAIHQKRIKALETELRMNAMEAESQLKQAKLKAQELANDLEIKSNELVVMLTKVIWKHDLNSCIDGSVERRKTSFADASQQL
jgi:hypothetical protein